LGKDLISKVLTEGAIVSTRLAASNIWLQNIIYRSNNHKVSISLLNEYLENIIMVGHPIVLKHTSEWNEILFESEIVEIHPDFPSHVKVNITGIKEQKNIRAFPRYDVYLASNVTAGEYVNDSFAIIHNISLVGVAFYSRVDLHPEEDNVKITMYLTNNRTVSAVGKINRKVPHTDFIEYGFQFTKMHEDNNNTLSSYFGLLEIDRTSLREEYINCIKKHM